MKKKILAVVIRSSNDNEPCSSWIIAGQPSSDDSEKSYTIGISQFAEHGSLDNCREGFLEGLKEEGIEEGKNLTVEVKNAQADTGTANRSDRFVSDKVDLVCAIATPSARGAYNSHGLRHSRYIYRSYRPGCSKACERGWNNCRKCNRNK